MKRRRRWIFNAVVVISLLISVTSAALWVRSYIGDGGGWQRAFGVTKIHLGMSQGTVEFNLAPAPHRGHLQLTHIYSGPINILLTFGDWGGLYLLIMFPLWMPTFGGLVLPATSVVLWLRRRPVSKDVCTKCGYDLRATPNLCPECGAIPDKASQIPIEPAPKY